MTTTIATAGTIVASWVLHPQPPEDPRSTTRSALFERVYSDGLEFLRYQSVYNKHLSDLMIGTRLKYPAIAFELLDPTHLEPVIEDVLTLQPGRPAELQRWEQTRDRFLTDLALIRQSFGPEVDSTVAEVEQTTHGDTMRALLLAATPLSITDSGQTRRAHASALGGQRERNHRCLDDLCALIARELPSGND